MKPFHLYTEQLFPSLSPAQLTTLSLPHIIPDDHVLAVTFGEGPTGVKLEFNYDGRKNT